jgi:reactive intermediate/imine deaminase
MKKTLVALALGAVMITNAMAINKIVKETDKAPAAIGPYSQTILVGNTLHIAGILPLDPATGQTVVGTMTETTKRVMDSMAAKLAANNMTMANVVSVNVYMANLNNFAEFNRTYATYFTGAYPARATIEAARLPRGVELEIAAIASKLPKGVRETDKAPAAIGPYSQTVLVGDTLHIAGILPLDPATGQMVVGTMTDIARTIMNSLGAKLAANGMTLANVVSTHVYMADLNDFGEFNRAYAEYFTGAYPARATIQAARLPRDARLEIAAIASTLPKIVKETDKAPAAIGPYSQTILVGDTLYIAGILPLDPATGQMVTGSMETITKRVMDSLGAKLAANNMTMTNVVNVSVFMADLNDFAEFNRTYATYFTDGKYPARQTIQAARLPRDARLEIGAIASAR